MKPSEIAERHKDGSFYDLFCPEDRDVAFGDLCRAHLRLREAALPIVADLDETRFGDAHVIKDPLIPNLRVALEESDAT